MENIKLIYIDDKPETQLSRFLDKLNDYIGCKEYSIESEDIEFNPDHGYESLLRDSRIQNSNILIIDSMLFENKTAHSGKFTGEEFKFVLQKFYPYIEVIIVSQNDPDDGVQMIRKYVKNPGEDSMTYYSNYLKPLIVNAAQNIHQYRIMSQKLVMNDSWESILKEKVLGTLNGTQTYDELTKQDIDQIVEAFKEIKKIIDG